MTIVQFILPGLNYIIDCSVTLGIEQPCIIFDQPLWLKTVEVCLAKGLNIVCRLGPFHMLMSYLGSLGSVMSGSGLSEALQTCFASNSVLHMMSGKAVSRAIRGHIMVESVLTTLLLQTILVQNSTNSTDDELNKLHTITESDMNELHMFFFGHCEWSKHDVSDS